MRIYNRGDAETLSLRTRSNFPRVSASLRLILILTVTLTACSVPNLEEPQCTEARDMVKRFYSFHFGNDMRLTPANVRAREQFLTPRLVSRLVSMGEPAKDYFTATENFPKAFRVGECSVNSAHSVTLQILLLWKDDTSSDQKEVRVVAFREGGMWLIDEVHGQ